MVRNRNAAKLRVSRSGLFFFVVKLLFNQAVDEVGALDGDFGGVGGFFFNARDGLFVVFGGQDGVGDGDVVVESTRVTPEPDSLETSSKW